MTIAISVWDSMYQKALVSEQVMVTLVVVVMVALQEVKLRKDFGNYYTERNSHYLVDKENVDAMVLNFASKAN